MEDFEILVIEKITLKLNCSIIVDILGVQYNTDTYTTHNDKIR